MDLVELFTQNLSPRQRQYEAIRAVAYNEGTVEEIASRFGYTPQSLRVLIHRVVSGKQTLFPDIKRGPKKLQTPPDTIKAVIQLRRRKRLNSQEIANELARLGTSISDRTVERILADAGFPKLRREPIKNEASAKKAL